MGGTYGIQVGGSITSGEGVGISVDGEVKARDEGILVVGEVYTNDYGIHIPSIKSKELYIGDSDESYTVVDVNGHTYNLCLDLS